MWSAITFYIIASTLLIGALVWLKNNKDEDDRDD